MPAVKLEQGDVKGVKVLLKPFIGDGNSPSAVQAYLGIPFAQPPIGTLRWKKPQRPAPTWKGTRPSVWRQDAHQELMVSEFFARPRRDTDKDENGGATLSEDCLYLNVWVPELATSTACPRPVLFWCHGGSFVLGSSAVPIYDGARLAAETGCIVVGANYRLGLFGWLGSRELASCTAGEGTGNYGAWDVVAALEWVQANISVFGGDASKVTAMGQSAGSILLHHLLLSPATPANLFARVLLMSGTALTKPARTLPSAQATFDALVTRLGGRASMKPEEKVHLLYQASERELLDVVSTFVAPRPSSEYVVDRAQGRPSRRMSVEQDSFQLEAQSVFGPVWDGVFLTEDYLHLATRGLPKQLRNGCKGLMLGHTVDEGSLFVIAVKTREALQQYAGKRHPDLVDQVKHLYGIGEERNSDDAFAAAAALIGDQYFIAPVREMISQLANQVDVPAYGYTFAHRNSRQLLLNISNSESAADLQHQFGATHSSDLPYLFGNDGTEDHIFERVNYPGNDQNSSTQHSLPRNGFTDEEKLLSLRLMKSVGKFAHGEPPWTQLNHENPSALEDCRVLSFGQSASLGGEISSHDGDRISIQEQRVGDQTSWKEALKGTALPTERHQFWTSDNFRQCKIAYYGDESITFLP